MGGFQDEVRGAADFIVIAVRWHPEGNVVECVSQGVSHGQLLSNEQSFFEANHIRLLVD